MNCSTTTKPIGKQRSIVIGLGNPILTDDGIGVCLAEHLRDILTGVDIVTTSSSGFHLLDYLLDYDRAIIIDAIVTHQKPPGSVTVYESRDFLDCSPFSMHSTDLVSAIEIWKQYRLPVPRNVLFIGIEVRDTTTFGENFSTEIESLREEIFETVREKVTNALEE